MILLYSNEIIEFSNGNLMMNRSCLCNQNDSILSDFEYKSNQSTIELLPNYRHTHIQFEDPFENDEPQHDHQSDFAEIRSIRRTFRRCMNHDDCYKDERCLRFKCKLFEKPKNFKSL